MQHPEDGIVHFNARLGIRIAFMNIWLTKTGDILSKLTVVFRARDRSAFCSKSKTFLKLFNECLATNSNALRPITFSFKLTF